MASPEDTRSSRSSAFFLLHRYSDLLARIEGRVFESQAGVSYDQFVILLAIRSSEPPVSMSAIARKVQRRLTTVSGIVDRMEERRLVKRVRSLYNRRTVYISMTGRGKDKVAQGMKVGKALAEQMGSALSEPEVRDLVRLLTKLRDHAFEEFGGEVTSIHTRPVGRKPVET
jgi:DNA-binding MarR family transcriptional regulator